MNVSESMKCEPLWDVQCRILSQIAGQINGRYISYGYNLYWICFFFFIFFIQIYWNTLFCLRQTFQLKQKKKQYFPVDLVMWTRLSKLTTKLLIKH